MNKVESAKILSILSSVFPNYYKRMSKQECEILTSTWQSCFKDVPALIVYEALNRCISTAVFPPTIGEVNSQIRKMYFIAMSVSNDARYPQNQRSEAANLTSLLYDLGYADNSRETSLNSVLNIISLGSSGFLGLEE